MLATKIDMTSILHIISGIRIHHCTNNPNLENV